MSNRLKLKVRTKIPAALLGGVGINVTKDGLIYKINLDYSQIAETSTFDPHFVQVATWNQHTNEWARVSLTDFLNGSLSSATFDAISPTTTRGDIIFRNATTNARLAAGTAGYFLQANGAGADPSYAGFLAAGTGAVTRTWLGKNRDIVSVTDFATVQLALDSGAAAIYFPEGTYLLGAVTVPATVKAIYGAGKGSVLKASGTITGGSSWISITSSTGLDIFNLSIDLNRTTYPTVTGVFFQTSDAITLRNLTYIQGGLLSIYGINSTSIKIIDCSFSNWKQCAVNLALCIGILISGNRSVAPSSTTGHVYDLTDGNDDITFVHNHCVGSVAGGFGLSIGGWTQPTYPVPTKVLVQSNTFIDTTNEAMHIAGINYRVLDNYCFWNAGVSTDFGMSFDDNGISVQMSGAIIARNIIVQAGKSGISFSGNTARFDVFDNTILDCNQLNDLTGHDSGIDIYNSTTNLNIEHTIHGNRFINNSGHMQYGVREFTGDAANNRYWDNTIIGAVVGDYNLVVSSRVARSFGSWNTTFTPAVTASAGTFTTASATMRYIIDGKTCRFRAAVTITSKGTATGAVTITMPIASVTGDPIGGADLGLGGALYGSLSAGTMTIVTYNNASPINNGAVLIIKGEYEIA